MPTFKIVKSKPFTFQDNGTAVTGTVYTLAHKGRVFNASTLSFDAADLVDASGNLEVKCKVELIPEQYTNALGQLITGYKLMPIMDLTIGAF